MTAPSLGPWLASHTSHCCAPLTPCKASLGPGPIQVLLQPSWAGEASVSCHHAPQSSLFFGGCCQLRLGNEASVGFSWHPSPGRGGGGTRAPDVRSPLSLQLGYGQEKAPAGAVSLVPSQHTSRSWLPFLGSLADGAALPPSVDTTYPGV